MDIQSGNPSGLNYLWWILLVVVAMAAATVARRRALLRFATSDVIQSLFPKTTHYRWVTNLLAVATLLALMPAICDIRWGETWRDVPQKGIEVVFALDVSRSMLADDVAPNRLERAKQQIKDMVDEMAGDRVGLVVFAGNAVRKIPLTSHYNDFKRALDEVSTYDVTRGGSNLGEAVRVGADSFLAKTTDHKAIVLFTDGEDHESDPIGVSTTVHRDKGVRIFTVGLGDDRQGARVPSSADDRRYLEHQGQQVWSKLDGKILKEMAIASNGAFIPAGTKQVNMAQVYHGYVADVEQQEFESARIQSYIPRFQWFVGTALLLCVAEVLISTRLGLRATSKMHPSSFARGATSRARPGPNLSSAAAILTALVVFSDSSRVDADEPDAYSLAKQGSQSLASGEVEEAVDYYTRAATIAPDKLDVKYNQAVVLYRHGDVDAARKRFAEVTTTADRDLAAKAQFNLGNCEYADALRLSQHDRKMAKEKATAAISHYRGALAANPSDTDARTNIELAALLLRRLNKPTDQQPEQQSPQRDGSSESENQPSQDQQSQQGRQDRSQPDSSEQRSEMESEEQKGETEDRQGESQPDGQSSEASQHANGGEPDSSEADNKTSDPTSRSEKDPSAADEADSQRQSKQPNQPASADPAIRPDASQGSQVEQSPQQRETAGAENGGIEKETALETDDDKNQTALPSGKLQAANEDAADASDETAATQIDQGKPMTRQEAMKMLQSVRDREFLRRLQNARRSERRYVPGDKDW